MDRFDKLLAQALEQARSLGIPASEHIDPHVKINRRAVTRFGCCTRRADGSFFIELTHRLLEGTDRACLQTLAHEILHTCPGCRNHGPLWREYAGRMNRTFGYAIARTGTCGELGVPDQRPVRHLVVCTGCGQEFPRATASPLVRHPERYRCKCGAPLVRKY